MRGRGRGRVGLQAPEELLRRGCSHLVVIEMHGGEGRVQAIGEGHVVEADYRDVAGTTTSGRPQRVVAAEGGLAARGTMQAAALSPGAAPAIARRAVSASWRRWGAAALLARCAPRRLTKPVHEKRRDDPDRQDPHKDQECIEERALVAEL